MPRELQRLLRTSLAEAGPPAQLASRLRETILRASPELGLLLPGGAEGQREQLRQALAWLVERLDQPRLAAAGCTQLGAVLREYGIGPQQTHLFGAALAEAMRAGMGNGWRLEFDAAWRTTWRLVHRWMSHGADAAAYTPATWSALVVEHHLRRPDLAVLRMRPYLPYRFASGQYTRVEVDTLPGEWRPYSLAAAPRSDNLLEMHVRAKGDAGVSGALVHRTAVGDRIRLRSAAGAMRLDPDSRRDLLMIAGDTGVAPFKAMLGELAASGDDRAAVLFWAVRDLDERYVIDELDALAAACPRATVVPVITDGDPGPYAGGPVADVVTAYGDWSAHEAFLAGPPAMVAATKVVLRQLGVAAERIHHDPPNA